MANCDITGSEEIEDINDTIDDALGEDAPEVTDPVGVSTDTLSNDESLSEIYDSDDDSINLNVNDDGSGDLDADKVDTFTDALIATEDAETDADFVRINSPAINALDTEALSAVLASLADKGVLVVQFEGDDGQTIDLTLNDPDSLAAFLAENSNDGGFSIIASDGDDTIILDDQAGYTIAGQAGNDSITGGTAADSISGGAGNDSITSGAGSDSVTTGTGNDSVDAGTGFDYAKYSGDLASYNISLTDGVISVEDTATSETDTWTNVEYVQFNDSALINVATADEAVVVRLFEAYNRQGDLAGTEYWTTQYDVRTAELQALGLTEAQAQAGAQLETAVAFISSPEWQDSYGTTIGDATAFVDYMYANFLDRDPTQTDDNAGRDYWIDAVEQRTTELEADGKTTADAELIAAAETFLAFAESQEMIDLTSYINVIDGLQ